MGIINTFMSICWLADSFIDEVLISLLIEILYWCSELAAVGVVEEKGWSDMNTVEDVLALISQGEGVMTEFKTGRFQFPENAFETICAFLNTFGGKLLLGVKDSKEIIGVEPTQTDAIRQQFVEAANNPNLLDPPEQFSVEQFNIDGKIVLLVDVPESQYVHRFKGRIYSRNESGDFDITRNQRAVAGLYAKNARLSYEDTVLPAMGLDSLDTEAIALYRRRMMRFRIDHPWNELDDIDLLKAAGLYQKDESSGKEGLTMGAMLLLGTEQALRMISANNGIDLIVRKHDLDRYDDRKTVETNIIKSYYEVMDFVERIMPDQFYDKGIERVSLRSLIFHEVISNVLAHRDYSNPMMTTFEFGRDRILISNSSVPNKLMIPDVQMISRPKNPNILRFLRAARFSDELGSGLRVMRTYGKLYGGADPEFKEGDIFTTTIRVPQLGYIPECEKTASAQTVSDHSAKYDVKIQEDFRRLLNLLSTEPQTSEQLKGWFYESDTGEFFWQYLEPAVRRGFVQELLPENGEPTVYRLTEQGKEQYRRMITEDILSM